MATSVFAAFIVTFIIGVMFMVVTGAISGNDCTREYYNVRTHNLVAVKNREGVEGSFIFGSGSFGARSTYRVYIERNGSIFQKEYDPRQTGIAEDVEVSSAHVETRFSIERAGDVWTRKFIDSNCRCKPQAVMHTLHVPRGTVVQQFTIE